MLLTVDCSEKLETSYLNFRTKTAHFSWKYRRARDFKSSIALMQTGSNVVFKSRLSTQNIPKRNDGPVKVSPTYFLIRVTHLGEWVVGSKFERDAKKNLPKMAKNHKYYSLSTHFMHFLGSFLSISQKMTLRFFKCFSSRSTTYCKRNRTK